MKKNKLEDVTILWFEDWYDGPLVGVCTYKGKWYWYERNKIDIFDVYEITKNQMEKEQYWHILYVRYVSNNMDCRVEDKWHEIKPESEHHKFYDKFDKWNRPKYHKIAKYIGYFK